MSKDKKSTQPTPPVLDPVSLSGTLILDKGV